MRPSKKEVADFILDTNKKGERLLQALDDFKALTMLEASRILNVKTGEMQNTIYILQLKEKIHKVDVWRNHPRAKYKLFPWYAGKRLYFIDKERLMEWIKMQVPPHEKTSKRFQSVLRSRVKKNFGIILEKKE